MVDLKVCIAQFLQELVSLDCQDIPDLALDHVNSVYSSSLVRPSGLAEHLLGDFDAENELGKTQCIVYSFPSSSNQLTRFNLLGKEASSSELPCCLRFFWRSGKNVPDGVPGSRLNIAVATLGDQVGQHSVTV